MSSSDPFHKSQREVLHSLNILRNEIQKLERGNGPNPILLSDQTAIQFLANQWTEAESTLKELSDTFAVQTSNAKQLALSVDELQKRKGFVEKYRKELDDLREARDRLLKGDTASEKDPISIDAKL